MTTKIVSWNANGLSQHTQELKLFLDTFNIDILLVSETHLTKNSKSIKINNYNIHYTHHPDGSAHGGTAIIIKSEINHNALAKYEFENIQATTIAMNTNHGTIEISSIYCPPRFNNNKETFLNFFSTLGKKFIVGGDFNA